MSKHRLNLEALRRNRLTRLFTGSAGQGRAPALWEDLALSRRDLFGVAAFAGLGLSPTVKVVERLLNATGAPFGCEASERRIAFTLHGKERWVIDSGWFGGEPRLTCLRSAGLIQIELAGATFPGTRLPADFRCEIRQGTLAWRMDLSFTLGGFRSRVPFVRWLTEKEPAQSPVRLDAMVCALGTGEEVLLSGPAEARFFPQWMFLFNGGRVASLRGFGGEIASDAVKLMLLDDRAPSLATRPAAARTLVSLTRGPRTWSLTPRFRADGHGHLTCPENLFQKVSLEVWDGPRRETEGVLLAEAGPDAPKAWFHPRSAWLTGCDDTARLPLVGARYVQLLGAHASLSEQAFLAEFDEAPVWLRLPGCSMEVGHAAGTPPFELVEAPGSACSMACEPAVKRVTVPMGGAVVEPMDLPPGARLNLAALFRPREAQPAVALGEEARITLTAERLPAQPKPKVPLTPLQKVEPAQAGSGSAAAAITLLKDFRQWMEVPAGAVSVVRPDDLLVLRFEFRGMTLQVAPGQKPRLVRAAGAPRALLVVHVPPQHIAEQAFFETQDPSGNEKVVYPIKAQIAGWSHLAFEIPPQMPELEYSLESLLDWARFQPVVALAAAPRPAPSILTTIGPRIFDRVGRLKLQMIAPPPVVPRSVPGEGQPAPQSLPVPATPPALRWQEVRGPAAPFERVRAILVSERHLVQAGPGQMTPRLAQLQQAPRQFQQAPKQFQQAPPPAVQQIKPGPIFAIAPSPPNKNDLPAITAIEAPFRLFLSPSVMGGWAHALSPVNLNGRQELWHSRLGVRKQGQGGRWFVDEEDDQNRTLRAIWSPDYDQPTPLTLTPQALLNGPARFGTPQADPARVPFRMLPEAQHRHQLVHLMANAKAFPTGWENRVADVHRFMLSSLGAWMKLRYAFDPAPAPLTVVEWQHIANMGRDQFVKVIEQGFLFPFGHKAVLVQVTERKFERTSEGIAAVVRYYEYIVVREPVKQYPGPGQEALTLSKGRNFPYRQVKITTLVTPKLDPRSNIPGVPGSSIAFWPRVSQQDFQFHLVGEDSTGQTSEFSAPLIFMTTDLGLGVALNNPGPLAKVREEYFKAGARNTTDLEGQKVAFAPPRPDGDTVLETTSLTFDAEVPCDPVGMQGGLVPPCPPQSPLLAKLKVAVNPLFYPFVREAGVSIPAVKGLVGTGPASDVTKVRYNELYRLNGFSGPNRGEVFLELITPVGLRFGQSDKVGGVGTPNLDIVALSRSHGPVGGGGAAGGQASLYDEHGRVRLVSGITRVVDPKQAAADAAKKFAEGKFDPKDFFKDAKILGGIPLGDIIGAVSDIAGGKAPKLITDRLPEELRIRMELAVPGLVDVLIFRASLPAPINKKATLTLKALIKVKLPNFKSGAPPAPPEPQFNAEGVLENFQINFFESIVASFKKFRFFKEHGKKPDVAVAMTDEGKDGIKPIEFRGALAFLAKLQELIPSSALSDPPSVELTPTGIKAGVSIAVPSVTVGALTLANMKFGAALLIPFTGDPVNLRINFCSRNDPMMGAVWIFGLTGFFALEVDTKGVQLVEVQIEFGGMWAFDIGVASGGVKLVAGIYFKYTKADGVFLEGYIKVQGCVSVLGIVTISLLIKLALQYSSKDDKVWGEATVELKVEILFFEVSVSYTCRKELAGSSSSSGSAWLLEDEAPLIRLASYDGKPYRTQGARRAGPVVRSPKIVEMLNAEDWNQYAGAFAADAA